MVGSSSPSGRPGAIIEGINVTPLVDIMLVLLVIFVVTAKMLATSALPMDLPAAASSQEVDVVLAVGIPAEGPTRVNGAPVADDAELRVHAALALAQHRDVRAVIQADGAVAHRRVIRALDQLRRAGLGRVAFAIRPDGEPGPAVRQ